MGCVHPGCRLRASGICAHPLPKSPLRAFVKMDFLVARINAQEDPCLQSVGFQRLDPNFGFYYRGFTTEDGQR